MATAPYQHGACEIIYFKLDISSWSQAFRLFELLFRLRVLFAAITAAIRPVVRYADSGTSWLFFSEAEYSYGSVYSESWCPIHILIWRWPLLSRRAFPVLVEYHSFPSESSGEQKCWAAACYCCSSVLLIYECFGQDLEYHWSSNIRNAGMCFAIEIIWTRIGIWRLPVISWLVYEWWQYRIYDLISILTYLW